MLATRRTMSEHGRCSHRSDPDRLLPADPAVRAIARRLYDAGAGPADHLAARARRPASPADDSPFADPTSLLITPDHYVTRLLHASGVPLERLGVGADALAEAEARDGLADALRALGGLPRDAGRATGWRRSWSRSSGSTERPSAETADAIYDQIADCLARAATSGRARCSSGSASRCSRRPTTRATTWPRTRRSRADPTWTGRVVPTFRPDRYLEPGRPGWGDDVDRLGAAADDRHRRLRRLRRARWRAGAAYFVAHGAISADHSHADVRTDPLAPRRGRPDLRAPRCAGAATAERGDGLPPAHAAARWPGCRATTGW